MFWADSLGSKYICSRLEEWSKTYGEFFKPCAYLAERAANGTSLVSRFISTPHVFLPLDILSRALLLYNRLRGIKLVSAAMILCVVFLISTLLHGRVPRRKDRPLACDPVLLCHRVRDSEGTSGPEIR